MAMTVSQNYILLLRTLLLAAAIICTHSAAYAGLTVQGPSGFIQVPSHRTIDAKEIELAVHTRMYKVPVTAKDASLSHMAFGFSPFRDFEVGFQKAMDSRNTASDPDPLINFKVRLPALGSGELTEIAVGGVFDTNPNNYHTLYFSVGGFGLGWNFGGNPWSGMANYGGYDRKKHEPQSLCLLIGAAYPERLPGERGYRGQFLLDYNGDVVSAGWRYSSHRGFWVDAAVHSKSNYTDFYDYRPLILGLGANF
ncbi:MAG: hypothetical protein GQF41_1352 [Candidatus Rifleibacterium amylolyticum]|nr:MAG: hypothetical protein GQF41_1352 [Candidatus Rifleibacterium amylolyticum]NLF95193.1 hypothetical protein [Candidatus Riflebacteria bacterium]